MGDREPWFLVMTQEECGRGGSETVRGKVVVRPIARQGWVVLIAFATTLTLAPLVIWLGLYLSGHLSLLTAAICTVMAAVAIVGGFVLLVQSRMTALPPG